MASPWRVREIAESCSSEIDKQAVLEEVNVSNQNVDGEVIVEQLGGYGQLVRVLRASWNNLHDLGPLARCFTSLTRLQISHNGLRSLDGIGQLTQLEVLDCSHNKLISLQPLTSCRKLTCIWAQHNEIVDAPESLLKSQGMFIELSSNPMHLRALPKAGSGNFARNSEQDSPHSYTMSTPLGSQDRDKEETQDDAAQTSKEGRSDPLIETEKTKVLTTSDPAMEPADVSSDAGIGSKKNKVEYKHDCKSDSEMEGMFEKATNKSDEEENMSSECLSSTIIQSPSPSNGSVHSPLSGACPEVNTTPQDSHRSNSWQNFEKDHSSGAASPDQAHQQLQHRSWFAREDDENHNRLEEAPPGRTVKEEHSSNFPPAKHLDLPEKDVASSRDPLPTLSSISAQLDALTKDLKDKKRQLGRRRR